MNKQQDMRDKRKSISELKESINESLAKLHRLCREQSATLNIHEAEIFFNDTLDGRREMVFRPPFIEVSITKTRRVEL